MSKASGAQHEAVLSRVNVLVLIFVLCANYLSGQSMHDVISLYRELLKGIAEESCALLLPPGSFFYNKQAKQNQMLQQNKTNLGFVVPFPDVLVKTRKRKHDVK